MNTAFLGQLFGLRVLLELGFFGSADPRCQEWADNIWRKLGMILNREGFVIFGGALIADIMARLILQTSTSKDRVSLWKKMVENDNSQFNTFFNEIARVVGALVTTSKGNFVSPPTLTSESKRKLLEDVRNFYPAVILCLKLSQWLNDLEEDKLVVAPVVTKLLNEFNSQMPSILPFIVDLFIRIIAIENVQLASVWSLLLTTLIRREIFQQKHNEFGAMTPSQALLDAIVRAAFKENSAESGPIALRMKYVALSLYIQILLWIHVATSISSVLIEGVDRSREQTLLKAFREFDTHEFYKFAFSSDTTAPLRRFWLQALCQRDAELAFFGVRASEAIFGNCPFTLSDLWGNLLKWQDTISGTSTNNLPTKGKKKRGREEPAEKRGEDLEQRSPLSVLDILEYFKDDPFSGGVTKTLSKFTDEELLASAFAKPVVLGSNEKALIFSALSFDSTTLKSLPSREILKLMKLFHQSDIAVTLTDTSQAKAVDSSSPFSPLIPFKRLLPIIKTENSLSTIGLWILMTSLCLKKDIFISKMMGQDDFEWLGLVSLSELKDKLKSTTQDRLAEHKADLFKLQCSVLDLIVKIFEHPIKLEDAKHFLKLLCVCEGVDLKKTSIDQSNLMSLKVNIPFYLFKCIQSTVKLLTDKDDLVGVKAEETLKRMAAIKPEVSKVSELSSIFLEISNQVLDNALARPSTSIAQQVLVDILGEYYQFAAEQEFETIWSVLLDDGGESESNEIDEGENEEESIDGTSMPLEPTPAGEEEQFSGLDLIDNEDIELSHIDAFIDYSESRDDDESKAFDKMLKSNRDVSQPLVDNYITRKKCAKLIETGLERIRKSNYDTKTNIEALSEQIVEKLFGLFSKGLDLLLVRSAPSKIQLSNSKKALINIEKGWARTLDDLIEALCQACAVLVRTYSKMITESSYEIYSALKRSGQVAENVMILYARCIQTATHVLQTASSRQAAKAAKFLVTNNKGVTNVALFIDVLSEFNDKTLNTLKDVSRFTPIQASALLDIFDKAEIHATKAIWTLRWNESWICHPIGVRCSKCFSKPQHRPLKAPGKKMTNHNSCLNISQSTAILACIGLNLSGDKWSGKILLQLLR